MNELTLKIETQVDKMTPQQMGEAYEKVVRHEYELGKLKDAIKAKMKGIMADKDTYVVKEYSNVSLAFLNSKQVRESYDIAKLTDKESMSLLASGLLTVDSKKAKGSEDELVKKCRTEKEVRVFTFKEIKK